MKSYRLTILFTSFCFGGLCGITLSGEEKKEPPVIKLTSPFAVIPGVKTSVDVRGLRLSDVTEVRFLDSKTAPVVTVKTKGMSKAPEKVAPEKVGDTQIDLELTIPADHPPGIIQFVVVNPQGQSQPHQLTVLDPVNTIVEREPNDGFATAQEMKLGQSLVGCLSPGQNVDVFRVTGKAGQRIRFEMQAAQRGGVLDSFLLLHNAQGQLLAEIDDSPESADPVLELTIPVDGDYFLSVLDVNDRESPLHCYVVTVK